MSLEESESTTSFVVAGVLLLSSAGIAAWGLGFIPFPSVLPPTVAGVVITIAAFVASMINGEEESFWRWVVPTCFVLCLIGVGIGNF